MVGLSSSIFQDFGNCSHNYSGRTVELNFNQSVLFDFGMSYSF
jgi:hypothetical protein